MNNEGIRIRVLHTRWQKTVGAMFRRTLGQEVLVFPYLNPAARLFHTFFCPPLRIIALTDDANALMDRVPRRNTFVPIPLSRLILECAPDLELAEDDFRSIASLAEIL